MTRTIGLEKECFITDGNGNIVPLVDILLPYAQSIAPKHGLYPTQFSPEPFAGQFEMKTTIAKDLDDLMNQLEALWNFLQIISQSQNCSFLCTPYVTEEQLGKLVVNTLNKRHTRLWNEVWNHAQRVAASQVAAINIHIGVTLEEAVNVLNYCNANLYIIMQLSKIDQSNIALNNQRLDSYRFAANCDGVPPYFAGTNTLLKYLKEKGEGNIWDLIRYKKSTGTIEFRMFGSTNDLTVVKSMTHSCLDVVEKAQNK